MSISIMTIFTHAHVPLLSPHPILLEPFFLPTYFLLLFLPRIAYMSVYYFLDPEKLTSGYTTEGKWSLLSPAAINCSAKDRARCAHLLFQAKMLACSTLCRSVLVTTAALSSYMQKPSPVQKTALHGTPPCPASFLLFLAPFHVVS